MKRHGVFTTVGAIVEKSNDPQRPILVQVRWKEDNNPSNGLLEIPAGHIEPLEHPFEALKRETYEESGIVITSLWPNKEYFSEHNSGWHSLAWTPFCVESCVNCTRIGLVFVCQGEGKLKEKGDVDAKEARWMDYTELKRSIENEPNRWFFFHIGALKKYIQAREKGLIWDNNSIPI